MDVGEITLRDPYSDQTIFRNVYQLGEEQPVTRVKEGGPIEIVNADIDVPSKSPHEYRGDDDEADSIKLENVSTPFKDETLADFHSPSKDSTPRTVDEAKEMYVNSEITLLELESELEELIDDPYTFDWD